MIYIKRLFCGLFATILIANSVMVANADTIIRSYWADVGANTMGDELVNPTFHPDGVRTVDITFESDSERLDESTRAITAVYNSDKALKSTDISPFVLKDGNGKARNRVNLSSADDIKAFVWNDMSIPICDSQLLTDKIGYKVPVIENNGNYTLRTAFEKDTIEALNGNSESAEYFITDEVQANSGESSLKITDRSSSGGTLRAMLDGVDLTSTVTASCYVRVAEGEPSRNFMIQAMVPTASGNKWPVIATAYNVGENWTKLEGSINLADPNHTAIDTPTLLIVATTVTAGIEKYFDYYIDDFLVTSDKTGTFYDDMEYTKTTINDDRLSQTPSTTSLRYKEIEDVPALKDVYKDYFKIGANVWNNRQSDTGRHGRLIKKHFNTIVSNGEFHIGSVVKTQSGGYSYDFKYVDDFMDFAVRNGLEVVGHALVWDRASTNIANYTGGSPTRENALIFMKEYITKVIKHCEGDGDPSEYTRGYSTANWHVDTWDVVNEAVLSVNENGNLDYNLDGGLSWYNSLGAEYVDYAFQYADETGYDDIKLRYNDFGEADQIHGNAIYQLVRGLKDNGKRVDVIGLQSHVFADFDEYNVLEENISRFSSLAKIDISELDVQAYFEDEYYSRAMFFEDGITREREFMQTKIYEKLFELYKKYSTSINRVNFWSVTDRYSAFNTTGYNHTEYAGIFDRDMQTKPSYWVIADKTELLTRYPEYEFGMDSASEAVLSWDFEDTNDITETPNTLNKWTYGTKYYTTAYYPCQPTIINLDSAENTVQYKKGDGTNNSNWAADKLYSGSDNKAAGSKKCAAIDIEITEFPATKPTLYQTGMKVKVSKSDLQPGKTYRMSFYAMTNNTSRGIYTNLLPFNTATGGGDSTDSWYKALYTVPWIHGVNVAGGNWVGDTSLFAQKDGIVKKYWQRFNIVLAPKESDFDSSGYANLWLMFAREPLYSTVNGIKLANFNDNDKFYVDDIAIFETSSAKPLSWNFESENQISPYGGEGEWTYAVRYYDWELSGTQYRLWQPKSIAVSDTQNTLPAGFVNSCADSSSSAEEQKSQGSINCLELGLKTNALTPSTRFYQTGTKVKLSVDDLNPGETYKLTFYAMTNNTTRMVHAGFSPYSRLKLYPYHGAVDWLDNNSVNGEVISTVWKKCEMEIKPNAEDFDGDGYTNLWIMFTRNPVFSGSTKKEFTDFDKFYLDDISIEKIYDGN